MFIMYGLEMQYLVSWKSSIWISYFWVFLDKNFSYIFIEIYLFLQLEPADPDFYKIGYIRSMRAYGVEFKEGPDGFGVYASKDVEPLRRARVSSFRSSDCTVVSFSICAASVTSGTCKKLWKYCDLFF